MKPHVCIYSQESLPSVEIKDICSQSLDCDYVDISNNTTLKQIRNLKIIHCVPTILQVDDDNDTLNLYHGKEECLKYLESTGSLTSVKKKINQVTNYQQPREVKGTILPNNLLDKPSKNSNNTRKVSIMEQAKQMSADRDQEMKRIGPPPIGGGM